MSDDSFSDFQDESFDYAVCNECGVRVDGPRYSAGVMFCARCAIGERGGMPSMDDVYGGNTLKADEMPLNFKAVLTVEHGLIPPTPNVDELDPRCPLAIVRGEPLVRPVEHVLANAIGFGGYYFSALVIGRA